MIKQLKIIIISFVVLVVLVAGIFFVSVTHLFNNNTTSSSSSQASSSSSISLINTDANNISKIAITSASGSFTISKTASNTWKIDNVDPSIVESDSVTSTVDSAAQFTADSVIAKNPTDLSVYGLDKPSTTIVITINNEDVTFYLGKENPLGNSYYLMEKGGDTVYLSSDAMTFTNSEMFYINTTLLTVDQTNDVPNITSFSFGGSSRTSPIDVSKESTSSSSTTDADSSGYTITQPVVLDVGSDQFSTLTSALASISADSCVSIDVSTANLKKYGLDNPKYTFSITIKNVTTTFLFGSTYSDEGSDYIYVMLAGRNAIYSVLTSSVPFYNYQITDIASPLPFIYNIDDVKAIIVQSGSNTWEFDLSGTSDNTIVKYDGKTLSTTYFKNYYQTVVGLEIQGETTASKNAQLLCKITFEFKDSTKPNSTSEFYSMNNGSFCSWDINGSTNFYTLVSSVNQLIANTKQIANNQNVIVT